MSIKKDKRNHLFIINHPNQLNLEFDSSVQMMGALKEVGHQVSWATIDNIHWQFKQKHAQAICYEFDISSDLKAQMDNANKFGLEFFTHIHMRQEPPVDHNFLYATWLLDTVSENTVILNSAESLRKFNEKLIISNFSDFILNGIVTAKDSVAIDYVVNQKIMDVVIKPLDSFGGRGVERITMEDDKNIFLNKVKNIFLNNNQPKLIQPFDSRVFSGEIRVFTMMGEDLAWCLKTPAEGSFLANTRNGASLKDIDPDPKLKKMVLKIAKSLIDHGIYVCGFDIIGDRVSEINITSPRLLCVDKTQAKNCYGRFAELLS